MNWLPVEKQREEIEGSRDCLGGIIGGIESKTFCYLYGRHMVTAETGRMLEEAEWALTFNGDL